MDADFSHDPAYLPRLLDAAGRADLVIGSRYVAGGGVTDWGPLRKLISRFGNAFSRPILGVAVRDLTADSRASAARCWKRSTSTRSGCGATPSRSKRLPGYSLGCKIVEVPIVFPDRRAGESKMDGAIVAEAIVGVPRLRFGFHHVRGTSARSKRPAARRAPDPPVRACVEHHSRGRHYLSAPCRAALYFMK